MTALSLLLSGGDFSHKDKWSLYMNAFFIVYVLQYAIKSIKYNKVNEIEEG